jgi:hypothetical protein
LQRRPGVPALLSRGTGSVHALLYPWYAKRPSFALSVVREASTLCFIRGTRSVQALLYPWYTKRPSFALSVVRLTYIPRCVSPPQYGRGLTAPSPDKKAKRDASRTSGKESKAGRFLGSAYHGVLTSTFALRHSYFQPPFPHSVSSPEVAPRPRNCILNREKNL